MAKYINRIFTNKDGKKVSQQYQVPDDYEISQGGYDKQRKQNYTETASDEPSIPKTISRAILPSVVGAGLGAIGQSQLGRSGQAASAMGTNALESAGQVGANLLQRYKPESKAAAIGAGALSTATSLMNQANQSNLARGATTGNSLLSSLGAGVQGLAQGALGAIPGGSTIAAAAPGLIGGLFKSFTTGNFGNLAQGFANAGNAVLSSGTLGQDLPKWFQKSEAKDYFGGTWGKTNIPTLPAENDENENELEDIQEGENENVQGQSTTNPNAAAGTNEGTTAEISGDTDVQPAGDDDTTNQSTAVQRPVEFQSGTNQSDVGNSNAADGVQGQPQQSPQQAIATTISTTGGLDTAVGSTANQDTTTTNTSGQLSSGQQASSVAVPPPIPMPQPQAQPTPQTQPQVQPQVQPMAVGVGAKQGGKIIPPPPPVVQPQAQQQPQLTPPVRSEKPFMSPETRRQFGNITQDFGQQPQQTIGEKFKKLPNQIGAWLDDDNPRPVPPVNQQNPIVQPQSPTNQPPTSLPQIPAVQPQQQLQKSEEETAEPEIKHTDNLGKNSAGNYSWGGSEIPNFAVREGLRKQQQDFNWDENLEGKTLEEIEANNERMINMEQEEAAASSPKGSVEYYSENPDLFQFLDGYGYQREEAAQLIPQTEFLVQGEKGFKNPKDSIRDDEGKIFVRTPLGLLQVADTKIKRMDKQYIDQVHRIRQLMAANERKPNPKLIEQARALYNDLPSENKGFTESPAENKIDEAIGNITSDMAKAKDVKTLKTNYRKIMENAKRWQLRVQDLKNLREEYKAMKHQLPDYGKRNTWSSRFGIGDIGSASEYNRRMARWHAQQGNPMQPNFTPSQMIEYQKFKGRKQYNEKEKPYIERTEATLKTLQEQYEKFKDKTTPRASNVARQIAQKETDLRRARRI